MDGELCAGLPEGLDSQAGVEGSAGSLKELCLAADIACPHRPSGEMLPLQEAATVTRLELPGECGEEQGWGTKVHLG